MGANKQIAKNTLTMFLRMCFIAVLGLISSRLMLQYLGAVDFGIYNVVGGVVNLMAFFNIVLASSTYRFLSIELGKGDAGNIGKVFSTSLIIHFIIGLVVIFLGETVGLFYVSNYLNAPADRVADSLWVYQISLFTCGVCVMQVPFQGLLISYENFTRYSVVQIVMMFGIFISSSVIGFIDNDRLVYFAVFMGVSQLLGFILYWVLSLKYMPKFRFKADKDMAKNMMGFSGWIALGAAATMGKNQGSNLVLNYYFGPIVNTAFSIGNQVNAQINRLSENITKSFNPQIMKTYVSGDYERFISLITACSKYSFFLLYLVAFPFFVKVEYILKLWLGNYPEYTVTFCNIMMLNILLSSLSLGIHPAVQATGKIKWFQIIGSSISLSTIPLTCISFMLGAPPYMISIAFLSTAVVYVFINYYMLKRILQFPIKRLINSIYMKVLPVVIVTIPFLFIGREIFGNNIIALVVEFIGSFIIVAVAIYLVGLTKSERTIISNFIKRKFLGRMR